MIPTDRLGRFVTFEGGEGVGKTTQLRRLAISLRDLGLEIVETREPGGAPLAERLRALLLDPDLDWSPAAETHLHFAARAEHLHRTVLPALARGATVLCDRFFDSTMAYQHHGAGADAGLIRALAATLPIRPDLTLVLQADAATRARRLASRGAIPDRYEAQDPEFHARVAAGFDAIARAEPQRCRIVDASGDANSVAARILHIVTQQPGLCPGPRQEPVAPGPPSER